MSTKRGTLERIGLYQSIMQVRSLVGQEPSEALAHVQRLVELSYSLKQHEGLQHAMVLLDELQHTPLAPLQQAERHYCQSLVWERLRRLRASSPDASQSPWDWHQHETQLQLKHLRRTLNPDSLQALPRQRLFEVLIKMGDLYNHVGCFSDALSLWARVLAMDEECAEARGKKGSALTHYAQALYDPSQVAMFLRAARADLRAALSNEALPEEVRALCKERLGWVEARTLGKTLQQQVEAELALQSRSDDEAAYRGWCLKHRLFLNPINDLGPYESAARDSLSVPPHDFAGRGCASLHGYFNQIKQAYATARFMLYEGISAQGLHYSDRGVSLYDTEEYASYCLAVEKTKVAFSTTYAQFDAIARFLNHYLALRIPEERVAFRTIWYVGQQPAQGLRPEFKRRKNWPMRGLYWLSKALHEDGLDEALEPDARQLQGIRQSIDRGYLKLHEDFFPCLEGDSAEPPSGGQGVPAMSLNRGAFELKALKVLKLARSAVLYLCLSVHAEQKQHTSSAEDANALPAPMTLKALGDAWRS